MLVAASEQGSGESDHGFGEKPFALPDQAYCGHRDLVAAPFADR
jgi:hypothetical protein